MADRQLLALFRAIAAADAGGVETMLRENPSLASAALVKGASRGDETSYFFDSIAHYAYAGDTALHIASTAYLSAVVTQLLGLGANVSAVNRRGAQPLHYACDGNPTGRHFHEARQREVIRILVEGGADPNAVDKSGVAPIHRAVRCRCAGAVEELLLAGADPRRTNRSGSTPLHLASRDTGRGGTGLPESRAAQQRIIEILRAV